MRGSIDLSLGFEPDDGEHITAILISFSGELPHLFYPPHFCSAFGYCNRLVGVSASPLV